MNIIMRELKSIRRSLLIWSGGIIFLIYVGMVKYDGFAKAGESASEMLKSLPEAMKAMFGLGTLDLAMASGYYVVFFMYFVLIGAIHAVMQGAIVLSKEERDKTADFLMVKPVRRRKVITSKVIASLIAIAIINVVTWITSIVVVGMFNQGPPINDLINELMIGMLLIQGTFFAIGLLVGALAKTTKKATGIANALLLGSFVLSAAIDMYPDIDFLTILTPFKYFDGKLIFASGIDNFYVLVSLLITTACLGATYWFYQKKDLHV